MASDWRLDESRELVATSLDAVGSPVDELAVASLVLLTLGRAAVAAAQIGYPVAPPFGPSLTTVPRPTRRLVVTSRCPWSRWLISPVAWPLCW